jgi:hypothetical protein
LRAHRLLFAGRYSYSLTPDTQQKASLGAGA